MSDDAKKLADAALDDVLSVCAAIVDCVTRGRRELGDLVEALEKSSRRLRRALNDNRE